MPFFGKSGTSRISVFKRSQSAASINFSVGVRILKLRSSNLKRIESRDWLGIKLSDPVYARRSRPFLQPRTQSSQLGARSHGQHLDRAIGIVSYPSRNLQNVRLSLDTPAEADPMDASMHEKATSLRARLIVGGSHCSIEEVRGQSAEVKPRP